MFRLISLDIINNKVVKSAIFVVLLATFLFCLFLPSFVLAQGADLGLEFAEDTGLGDTDPRIIIARIIRIIIGFLGIIAVSLVMYAGWLWMTSEGNEEKITQAKNILKSAIIGLIIILSSFAIASFVLSRLLGSGGGGIGAGGGPGGGMGGRGFSALGNSIIESHYPSRNKKDIPRNTKIVITFKEPIDVGTIIADGNINSSNIHIYRTKNPSEESYVTDVVANKTEDNKTFVFKPAKYLGSPSENIWYTVALGSGIKKANGDSAFPGVGTSIVYEWSFEVSTFIDLTPPKIESIIPFPDDGEKEPRNVVIQINFDEAVDPTAVSGSTANGFKNIIVNNDNDNIIVEGNFYISNEYKTVEFLTEDICGVNSCGETIYCLPGGKILSVLAKSSELEILGDPTSSFPYTGVVDMADNSLDGNGDGLSQGPTDPPYDANNPDIATQGDSYTWSFKTSNEIDITPPKISDTYPKATDAISLDTVPIITYDKLLMSSSINSDSVMISGDLSDINYWISKRNNKESKETKVSIKHDQFAEDERYYPRANQGIKDIYQNCYTPCSGMDKVGAPSCCDGVSTNSATCPDF